MQRPMSMNGYSWVEGNTPNMVDPSGMCSPLAVLCDDGGSGGADGASPRGNRGGGTRSSGVRSASSTASFGNIVLTESLRRALSRLFGATIVNELRNQCIEFIEGVFGDVSGGVIPIPQNQSPADFLDFSSSQVSQEYIEELSRACRAGNGQYNSACNELYRLCQAGYEDACGRARSTCDDAYLDALQNTMHSACDVPGGRGCEAGNHTLFPLNDKHTLCQNAARRILINSQCAYLRTQIINECFQGITDRTHGDQIMNAMGTEENCWEIFLANNCSETYLQQ